MIQVGIIMGSDSDLGVMRAAADTLTQFGVEYELTIVSAHRTPERMVRYARTAAERGLKAIIAGAGGAAHLPGMVAAMTTVPVIGVPVNITAMQGQDSLLSIVQMPKGIPVATVAIDNSANAALLALRIIGVSEPSVAAQLAAHLVDMEQQVLAKPIRCRGVWSMFNSELSERLLDVLERIEPLLPPRFAPIDWQSTLAAQYLRVGQAGGLVALQPRLDQSFDDLLAMPRQQQQLRGNAELFLSGGLQSRVAVGGPGNRQELLGPSVVGPLS